MKILIWSLKGGVGKSHLSMAIGYEHGFVIVTNELLSPVSKIYPEGKIKVLAKNESVPELPNNVNVVYDFMGAPDDRALDTCKIVDVVIIPTTNEGTFDIQHALESINQLKAHSDKIMVVVNKTKKGDYNEVKKIINKFYEKIPVLELKHSKAISGISKTGKSIREQIKPWNKRHFEKPLEQLDLIVQEIERIKHYNLTKETK